jgi:hypothetical protein
VAAAAAQEQKEQFARQLQKALGRQHAEEAAAQKALDKRLHKLAEIRECALCRRLEAAGATGAELFKRCGKSVLYCSQEHQHEHWATHKADCQPSEDKALRERDQHSADVTNRLLACQAELAKCQQSCILPSAWSA